MDKDNKNITKLTSLYLSLSEKSKSAHLDLWNKYAEAYNKDKDLGKQLRLMHKALYFALLEVLQVQIYKDKENNPDYAFNPAEPYLFTTNNIDLMRILFVRSDKTVYNLLNRLIDADVVIKKGHGAHRNYIIAINPDLVLLETLTF